MFPDFIAMEAELLDGCQKIRRGLFANVVEPCLYLRHSTREFSASLKAHSVIKNS